MLYSFIVNEQIYQTSWSETLLRTIVVEQWERLWGMDPGVERAELGRGTGQNLVWLTEMALIRACIERRPGVVANAFARIAEEVRVTTKEGIQPDLSFLDFQLGTGRPGERLFESLVKRKLNLVSCD